MPHSRASFGHRASAGFFRCQRACTWTHLTISVKFAPAESGRCTNSPTSSPTLLHDSGLGSQPDTGRYCAVSRKRSYEEEHVKDSFPDSFDTPWDEPPRKMLHTSSADEEDNRDWSSKIRESLRQENRLPHCDGVVTQCSSTVEAYRHFTSQGQDNNDVKSEDVELDVISTVDKEGDPESRASNILSDPEIQMNIWMQPAASPSLVFTASAESIHDFTAVSKRDHLSDFCPPISDPPPLQSSQLASATCTDGIMDQNGVHAQKLMLNQASLPSLPASPDPLLLIPFDFHLEERLPGKLATDVKFPTDTSEQVYQSPMKFSAVEEGVSDRVVTCVADVSFIYTSTTCSHKKKRLQESRLRAKAKVVAHRVKLIVEDDEDKPTPLERERRKVSSKGNTCSLKLPPPYKQHGVLEAMEEGEEATTDDERLRTPGLSMLEKGGRNNFTSDYSFRKECKASYLRIAESLLFDKVLTKTDTSGLGRIILPKRPAEQYLPHVPCKEGIEMEFEDCNGKIWKGRLRYWVNKSKMYVIEGAGGFLREHKLALGDKILLCSTGSDKKLLFRYERGPFLPQTPCNVATPLSPTAPTLPPSRHILAAIPNTPIPHPSSLTPLPETFFSSSTTFSSKLHPGLHRNIPHFSSTSPLPRTHSFTQPSTQILNPTAASLRPTALPYVPPPKPSLQSTSFPPTHTHPTLSLSPSFSPPQEA